MPHADERIQHGVDNLINSALKARSYIDWFESD